MVFSGSIVALVTPLNQDLTLDQAALTNLIDWHIQQGTNGLVVMGTTGESATLSPELYQQTIKLVVEHTKKRIPVIAGVTAITTAKVIDNIKLVEALGVDGTLLAPPYYIKPPQAAIVKHFTEAAAASPLPMILYNVPGRTAVDMSHETIITLSQLDNVVAIKDATAELNRISGSKASTNEDFALLSGDDPTACDFMLQGGHGVISVTANVAPKAMAEMCQAALIGDKDAALTINEQLADLHDKLFIQANPIPVKWCLAAMQRIKNIIAPPLQSMESQFEPVLRNAMLKANLEGELE